MTVMKDDKAIVVTVLYLWVNQIGEGVVVKSACDFDIQSVD